MPREFIVPTINDQNNYRESDGKKIVPIVYSNPGIISVPTPQPYTVIVGDTKVDG